MPKIYNKSFLKWAGGKSQLLDRLFELMPDKCNWFIEPFLGSGVVSLNICEKYPNIKEVIIGDTNPGLIALWNELQNDGLKFISFAKKYFAESFNREDMYYELRGKFNTTWHNDVKAVTFLYLNRHCFNGLCRFNSKGGFNVPYGKYKSVYFPEKEMIHAIEVLKKTRVYHQGFMDTFEMVKKGDVVYLDPPYVPENDTTATFTAYSKDKFGIAEHIELVKQAIIAQKKGATVIISNNDVPVCKELYGGADEIHYVDVRKSISCKANGRKKLKEIIAVYRP